MYDEGDAPGHASRVESGASSERRNRCRRVESAADRNGRARRRDPRVHDAARSRPQPQAPSSSLIRPSRPFGALLEKSSPSAVSPVSPSFSPAAPDSPLISAAIKTANAQTIIPPPARVLRVMGGADGTKSASQSETSRRVRRFATEAVTGPHSERSTMNPPLKTARG